MIYVGRVHALAGQTAEAKAMIERLRSSGNYVAPSEFATLYAAVGDRDNAFAELEKAGFNGVCSVEVEFEGEPWPALAVDRHWTMLSHNATVPLLLQGVDAALLQGPVNVLRLSLHPGGLASRIANLATWRACCTGWRNRSRPRRTSR